jgi:leucyl-tRNA synthetase
MTEAYVDDGIMVNSQEFDGMENRVAIEKITDSLAEKGLARRTTHYRLKDWLISRQRYWGAPIPMIHCDKCGTVPVPVASLPVLLPDDIDFLPRGDGKSPLAASDEFVRVECPECGGTARRDTDTMDTFVDSSWYFLRYLSPDNEEAAFETDLANKWLPVDQYIGGIEHAILHLLYARYIVKFLCDRKMISFDEPFESLFTQGMITRNGAKMSKRAGNSVDPKPLIERYGADTVRIYTLFIGPPEKDAEWNDRAVEGASRFINRVWRLYSRYLEAAGADGLVDTVDPDLLSKIQKKLYRKIQQTISRVKKDILGGTFHFNTAISALMELVNDLYLYVEKDDEFSKGSSSAVDLLRYSMRTILLLLAPMAPHICEEIWERVGNESSIFINRLPEVDPDWLQSETYTLVVQINGKIRSRLEVPDGSQKDELEKIALEDEKIISVIGTEKVRKVIVIPGRLVNIVI